LPGSAPVSEAAHFLHVARDALKARQVIGQRVQAPPTEQRLARGWRHVLVICNERLKIELAQVRPPFRRRPEVVDDRRRQRAALIVTKRLG